MIIRTPTRTKTRSFKGTQMEFKFPSTENLPHDELEEVDLNNHHLLNVNLKKDSTSHDESDNVSQILSDYTSTSNTNSNTNTNSNSSNGYYSFANISDNTTSPRFFVDHTPNVMSALNLNGNGKLDYPMTLAPEKSHSPISSPLLRRSSSSNSVSKTSMVSKSKSQLQMASIPENIATPAHRVNTSIPNADNISYEIVTVTSNVESSNPRVVSAVSSNSSSNSSSMLRKNHSTVRKHPLNIDRIPSVREVNSIRLSSASRVGSSQTMIRPALRVSSLNSKNSHNSKLKRSNAIRFKGGLLAYFTFMGIKIKHGLKKLRIVIRRKLFSFTNQTGMKRSPSRSSNLNTKKPINKSKKNKKMNHSLDYSTSSKNNLTTSHLMRTHGYVSNLQRSISQSSRKSSMHRPLTNLTPPASVTDSVSNNNRPIKQRTTLRRTNSSIRRAASTLAATPNTNRNSMISQVENKMINDSNMNEPIENDMRSNSYTMKNSNLVRSGGMCSLNSVIREPSIVVKNKVIPLTMGQYPIKEEDEYVIDTNSMTKLSPVASANSSHSSYFDANDAKSSIYSMENEIEEEKEDEEYEAMSKNTTNLKSSELQDLLNVYYRTIISKRITLRLQMGKYQDGNNLAEVDEEYKELLETLLSDTESQSDVSEVFDQDESHQASDEAEDYMDTVPEIVPQRKRTINFNIMSSFGNYSVSQNASLLSIPTNSVKRSLTLPIGMNI